MATHSNRRTPVITQAVTGTPRLRPEPAIRPGKDERLLRTGEIVVFSGGARPRLDAPRALGSGRLDAAAIGRFKNSTAEKS
jgi:hypothetical protein